MKKKKNTIHSFFCPPLLLDPSITTSPQTEELFDLIASSQSRRLDDQRVNVGSLPGLRITHNNLGHLVGDADHQEPSDDFFNMLIKCQVGASVGFHRLMHVQNLSALRYLSRVLQQQYWHKICCRSIDREIDR